jgi:hypothetical protein
MTIIKYDHKKNVHTKKKRKKERLKKRIVKKIQCIIREKGMVHLLNIKSMHYWFISSNKIQFYFVEFFSLE